MMDQASIAYLNLIRAADEGDVIIKAHGKNALNQKIYSVTRGWETLALQGTFSQVQEWLAFPNE